MKRINFIRLLMEFGLTIILLLIFPFTYERRIKLFLLYAFCQFLAGRFHKNTLLFYDELKYIVLGYLGFAFCGCLTVAFRQAGAWLEVVNILIFSLIDLGFTLFINRMAHIWFKEQVRKPVIILGTGKTARKLHNVMLANRFSTMDVVAFVDCNDSRYFDQVNQEEVEQQAPVVPFDQLDELIVKENIDTALIAIPEITHEDLYKISTRLAKSVDNVKYLPYTQDLLNYGSNIDDFDGLLMVSTSQGKISGLGKAAKRALDLAGAAVGMVILGGSTLFVWAKMRMDGDKGPVFFKQERIGKDGKTFVCWKYRTMEIGAEEKLKKMLEEDPKLREEYMLNRKLQDDPRVTRLGKKLRKYSIDELPQFINILKGEMSLIGPRPYLLSEAKDMGDYYESVIAFAPGMSGMWQTHGRSQVSFDQRLQLDDFYYRNWTMWLDFTILMKTFQIILSGDKGAV